MWLGLKNPATRQIIVKRKTILWMSSVYVAFQLWQWGAVRGKRGWWCMCILCHAITAIASALPFALSSHCCVSSLTSSLQFPQVLLSFPDTFTVIFSAQSCDCMPSSCMSHVIYLISLIVTWEMCYFWNLATVRLFEINSELLKGELNDRQPVQMVKLTHR